MPPHPANIYLFKVNNRNTRKRCEIYSKLAIKTPERRQWHRSDVFIVNFEHVSYLYFSVSIVDFEQVNVSWISVASPCKVTQLSNLSRDSVSGILATNFEIFSFTMSLLDLVCKI